MATSSVYQPLETMTILIQNMTEKELTEYVSRLSAARALGPAKVARSKETGAPKGGRSASPMSKLDALLNSMSPMERQIFLNEMQENAE